MQPLLARAPAPMTPLYPPNTPSLGTYPSDSILDDSAPPSADPTTSSYFPMQDAEQEEHTVRYSDHQARMAAAQAHANSKSMYEQPSSPGSPRSERSSLTRRGTAPSRPSRHVAAVQQIAPIEPSGSSSRAAQRDDEAADDRMSTRQSLRRMRSAAELRQALEADTSEERPPISRNGSSAALAKYQNIFPANLNAELDVNDEANLERAAKFGSVSSRRRMARAHTTQSIWSDDKLTSVQPVPSATAAADKDGGKGGKQGKWGFLKKMSMGKLKAEAMRTDSPSPLPASVSPPRPRTAGGEASSAPRLTRPFDSESGIDLTSLGIQSSASSSATSSFTPSPNPSPGPALRTQPSVPSLAIPMPQAPMQPAPALSPPSPFLLPPGTTPRSAKRRSFLPIDRPSIVSSADTLTPLSIPPSTRSSTAVGDDDPSTDTDAFKSPFSDPTPQSAMPPLTATPQTRALRSVMAYLRDLSDLSAAGKGSSPSSTATSSVNLLAALSQDMSLGMDDPTLRQRRPTIGERVMSDGSFASTSSDPKDASEAGTEDRKYKDDKGKRAMIVREIVEYVEFIDNVR